MKRKFTAEVDGKRYSIVSNSNYTFAVIAKSPDRVVGWADSEAAVIRIIKSISTPCFVITPVRVSKVYENKTQAA